MKHPNSDIEPEVGNAFAIQDGKVANYQSDRGARNYKADHANKLQRRLSTAREMRIFDRFFEQLGPIESALDLPCGNGRLLEMLRSRATTVIEADFSGSMLGLNLEDHGRGGSTCYVQCSALDIPLASRSVDLVLSIRLSHHLETQEARETHLGELFRVADKAVIVSWFSATSLKNIWRMCRAPVNHKKPKNTLATGRVRELALEHGFDLVDSRPLHRLSSGHVFALLVRR